MKEHLPAELLRRFTSAGVALAIVLTVGSAGYYAIMGGHATVIDCTYMTVITILSIGFAEVVDLSDKPGGRVFTMCIALAGIAVVSYLLSNLTAFLVEGDLSERFWRRNMEKKAAALSGHYVVCGAGQVGANIVRELWATQRACVVIDLKADVLHQVAEMFRNVVCLPGDASDTDLLRAAGVERARGLFAATDDDYTNLAIALTARQLNAKVTVVARCGDTRRISKLKAAGADAVISPSFIGGLRMASEMVRPTVVSFLDIMLRRDDTNLRIEELAAPLPGKTVGDLELGTFEKTLLLALRSGNDWIYNPKPAQVLAADSRLVVMTTPEDRAAIERRLEGLSTPA